MSRGCRRFISLSHKVCVAFIGLLPWFRFIRETRDTETPITFGLWFAQKVLRINDAYWPIHPSSTVTYPKNVSVGIETNPGYNPGCYVHGVNRIFLGDYTQIGPNVGLMSGNHDPCDLREQLTENPIRIGRYCWIGMGAVVLPGVVLGDFTIVGAGTIVTKSFPGGYCVIVGTPPRVVRSLDPEQCVAYSRSVEYNGYIRHADFEGFASRHLNLEMENE